MRESNLQAAASSGQSTVRWVAPALSQPLWRRCQRSFAGVDVALLNPRLSVAQDRHDSSQSPRAAGCGREMMGWRNLEPGQAKSNGAAQPQSHSMTIGRAGTFTVSALGEPPLACDWFLGTNVILGATATTFTITNAQSGAAGTLGVAVTNGFGSATRTAAVAIDAHAKAYSGDVRHVRQGYAATIAPWLWEPILKGGMTTVSLIGAAQQKNVLQEAASLSRPGQSITTNGTTADVTLASTQPSANRARV